MHQPNDDWNEFDWEAGLRESDEYAARYFRLLKRFCDLPAANELIADHMGPDFQKTPEDCDMQCDNCASRWQCEFSSALDWITDDADTLDDIEDDDGGEAEVEPDGPPEQGDSLFFEADPVFVMLRQAAIGWCNIYAVILPADARPRGLRILFHIGRSLANLAYSIGDGLYEQPPASIAFAKRSLGQLNQAVGLLNQMIAEKPRLRRILSTIRTHLMNVNSALIDHLQRCRRETEADGPAV